MNTEWDITISSSWVREPNINIPLSWGLKKKTAKSMRTATIDSDTKSSNEQDILDNVASFITADGTESGVPSSSNISVSIE